MLVRIENLSGEPAEIKYRRVMDWDIEPTPFNEFVTIQKGTSPFLVETTNDGFDTANPLLGPSNLGRTGSFVDAGPDDHGANFTFNFGTLPPGETFEFFTFYGAAGNEVDAVAAISAVGAEAYSFGQPGTVPDGRDLGEPNTFIFAFRGIGGGAVVPPRLVEVTPEAGGNCGMVTVLGLGSGFKPGADMRLVRLGQPDIVATDVMVATDGFSIQGTFDLNMALLGPWDVVVTNPDDGDPATDEQTVLPNGFTVEDCEPMCSYATVIGPSFIAANRPSLYNLVVNNVGNVDMQNAMVTVRGIPADIPIELIGLSLVSATPVPGGFDVQVPLLQPDVPLFFPFRLTAPPPVPRMFTIVAETDTGCFDPSETNVTVLASVDPNLKAGPPGWGAAGFLRGTEPLNYSIMFENDPAATAPAQEVVVTDQLDVLRYGLDTFGFGPMNVGTQIAVAPLPGLSDFGPVVVPFDIAADLNMNGNLTDDDILVRIEAHLITDPMDPNHGRVTWELRSIDPTTGMLPVDPRRGFLPPNMSPPEGDGSLLFTVSPLATLSTGDEIRNRASIVFDRNAPIETPEWLNTIDKTPPVSAVDALPATQTATTFPVSWAGTDMGSGVSFFDVFFTEDGGPVMPLVTGTSATSTTFTGVVGHTYQFYSVAQDNVGHREDPPATFDATTTIVKATPTSPDECKKGGYAAFGFKNQGLCIASVVSNGKKHK